MKVLVAETIAEGGVERLRAEATVDVKTDLTREQLLEIIEGYDALIVRSQTMADAELIDRGKNLKVIGRAGIGLDNVDVDAATRHGIVVVNAPQSNVLSAAEHAMALMLSQARNIPAANESVRAGKWERARFEGVELHGKVLAILGLGRIGTLVAQRALAFGMRVVAYDPYVAKQRAGQMGVELVGTVEEALRAADFVTIHLPKTAETAALIGAAQLALMKPTARIVNTSRGGIVDEAALAEAVSSGKLGGAALDVFENEPPGDSPLFAVEQIVLTPHLGASTEEAQSKAGEAIAEQVALALRGELAPYAVNVEAGRELSDVVRAFLPLSEKLGRIFTALSGGHIHDVRFSYQGQIADHDTRVLTLSGLKGMFSAVVHEPVTFVNAPLMAAERGIRFEEMKSAMSRDYVNLVEVSGADAAVAGTLVGVKNEERLVRIFDFEVDFPPGPHMCFLRYDDRPGVIGAIGTILGGAGVNIADMRVGRQEKGGEALMCLTVDQPIDADVLKELVDGSEAKDAKVVTLG
ncbi:MAG TPA: phosphoglycerate dehydrogenase [Actinomycetota bacterium]|nr:phosphoglycerate dehydrogenase [Actinomycetota bacterium]